MHPLVSFVTPTMGRPEMHQQLYEGFCADEWPNKELVIYDESAEPSPFFSSLQDDRVVYVHDPSPVEKLKREVNTIGLARNKANALSHGDFIEHRDDDDVYSPGYTTAMMERIGDASIAKLDVFRIVTDTEPALILEWDTRKFGGTHYALMGDKLTRSEGAEEMPHEVAEMFRDGYGLTLFYPRSTWERHPFPEEGTEDFPFVREVRAAGEEIRFVSDLAHLVLHLVSKRSGSGVFPQKIVGLMGVPDEEVRQLVTDKMLAGLGSMREITKSGKKFPVKAGAVYSVLVSAADKHTLKSLSTQASKWGVTVRDARDVVDPGEFGVNAPPPGYRLVHLTATVDKDNEMPWEVPAPLSAFDKTRVLRAWSDGLGAVRSADYQRSRMAPGWWWRGR